jgi:hypothetical protein
MTCTRSKSPQRSHHTHRPTYTNTSNVRISLNSLVSCRTVGRASVGITFEQPQRRHREFGKAVVLGIRACPPGTCVAFKEPRRRSITAPTILRVLQDSLVQQPPKLSLVVFAGRMGLNRVRDDVFSVFGQPDSRSTQDGLWVVAR